MGRQPNSSFMLYDRRFVSLRELYELLGMTELWRMRSVKFHCGIDTVLLDVEVCVQALQVQFGLDIYFCLIKNSVSTKIGYLKSPMRDISWEKLGSKSNHRERHYVDYRKLLACCVK